MVQKYQQEPVYKDVKVVFRVIEPNTSDRTLINTAEINEDSNEYDMPDVDSVPGNGLDGEDDIDKEYVVVRYFDLALRKFITQLNDEEITNRVPQVVIDEEGKITYNHTKEPIAQQAPKPKEEKDTPVQETNETDEN